MIRNTLFLSILFAFVAIQAADQNAGKPSSSSAAARLAAKQLERGSSKLTMSDQRSDKNKSVHSTQVTSLLSDEQRESLWTIIQQSQELLMIDSINDPDLNELKQMIQRLQADIKRDPANLQKILEQHSIACLRRYSKQQHIDSSSLQNDENFFEKYPECNNCNLMVKFCMMLLQLSLQGKPE